MTRYDYTKPLELKPQNKEAQDVSQPYVQSSAGMVNAMLESGTVLGNRMKRTAHDLRLASYTDEYITNYVILSCIYLAESKAETVYKELAEEDARKVGKLNPLEKIRSDSQ